MRTLDTRSDKLISEMIIYPHPHTKAIHTLAAHELGTIDEGTAIADGNAIIIGAERADRHRMTTIEQRIEYTTPATIRISTWAIQNGQRIMIADNTYRAAEEP